MSSSLRLSKRWCVQERVAAMKARQEAEKARQEGKRAVEGEVAAAVGSWRFGKDLLQQLTTLDQIWPGAPPVDRAAIDSDAAVKKLYFKAVRCVHPDKIGEGSRSEPTNAFSRGAWSDRHSGFVVSKPHPSEESVCPLFCAATRRS